MRGSRKIPESSSLVGPTGVQIMSEDQGLVRGEENSSKTIEMNKSTPPIMWAKALATPPDGDIFSPARPVDDKECLHGSGKELMQGANIVSTEGLHI